MKEKLNETLRQAARDAKKQEEETSGLQPHGDGSEMKPHETTPREATEVLARWPFPSPDDR